MNYLEIKKKKKKRFNIIIIYIIPFVISSYIT